MLSEKEFLNVFKDSLHIEEPEIDDEDWFYDSIRKYKHLLMYELAFVTRNIQFSSPWSICTANSSSELVGNKEILQLSVPQKLIASYNGKDEGLCKDRDFEIMSGTLTTSPVDKLVCSSSGLPVLVTTLQNSSEAVLYRIGDESEGNLVLLTFHSVTSFPRVLQFCCICGEIKHVQQLYLPWTCPAAAMTKNGSHLAFAQSSRDVQLHSLDCLSLTTSAVTPLGSDSQDSSPLSYLQFWDNENSLFMCEEFTGRLCKWDLRTKSSSLLVNQANNAGKTWAAAAGSNLTLFARLNCEGDVELFDIRQCSQSLSSFKVSCLPLTAECLEKTLTLVISPDSKCISVSGLDNMVYVYRIDQSKVEQCFVHEGHSKSHLSSSGFTTTHQWHPSYENLIISTSSNHSLHAWQFNT